MATLVIYKIHIWLRHISPMIWRRLLVRSDTSLLELHHIIQIAFDWSDDRQHRFHIHGKDFGQYRVGGLSYSDNPSNIVLSQFSFRENERFSYTYSFFEFWEHVVRIEAILPLQTKLYPLCISGKGKTPPEDCGGAKGFSNLKDTYPKSLVYLRIAEILSVILDQTNDSDDNSLPDINRSEMSKLLYWATLDKINRTEINHKLERYRSGEHIYDLVESIENREDFR